MSEKSGTAGQSGEEVWGESPAGSKSGTALSAALERKMNEQIVHELGSAYTYLAMSAYCERRNLRGMAHWLRVQAREELEHGMKFYDFILDRGGKVELDAIPRPAAEFGSPVEIFRKALAHEQRVTGLIHELYALATQEKDYASQAFLDWFVTEQVEEEKITSEVVATLELVGDEGQALYLVDRDLGAREDEDDEDEE